MIDRFGDMMPEDLEQAAIREFEHQSLLQTGDKWKWEESDEEIRNHYRIRVLVNAVNQLRSKS